MLQIHRKQEGPPAFIPDFTDPLGLLVHCHRKIDAQFRALEHATRLLRNGNPATAQSAYGAIDAAQAHFAGPGMKHTADEEESLFPRLRHHAGPSEWVVLQALDRLEAQHTLAERLHLDFDVRVDRLKRDEVLSELELDRLERCIGALAGLYGPHMRVEDDVIFPAAARLLPPEELLAVGREMRMRRAAMFAEKHSGS